MAETGYWLGGLYLLGINLLAYIAFGWDKRLAREERFRIPEARLLLYAALEIVKDSTRIDSPLMHFRLIPVLNQWSAFISLAQIFAAFTALGVLIHFSRCSLRCNGFRWYHPLVWLGFAGCLFGIGKLGEYNVQRYATYLKCYSIMSVSCILMVALIWGLYRSCVSRRELD